MSDDEVLATADVSVPVGGEEDKPHEVPAPAAPTEVKPPAPATPPVAPRRERYRSPEFDAERAELAREMAEMRREATEWDYDSDRERRIKKQTDDVFKRLGFDKSTEE